MQHDTKASATRNFPQAETTDGEELCPVLRDRPALLVCFPHTRGFGLIGEALVGLNAVALR